MFKWELVRLSWALWWQRGWHLAISRHGLSLRNVHRTNTGAEECQATSTSALEPPAQRDPEVRAAEALCDLLSNSKSASKDTVTRVRLVGARSHLVEAVETAAASRGLTAVTAHLTAGGYGEIAVERPSGRSDDIDDTKGT